MVFKISIVLILSISCIHKQDIASCDELSMHRYKGLPNSSSQFEKHCKEAKIKYTSEVCQAALTELIRTHSLVAVKEEFGAPIEHCFTGNDLGRFNKD
jgi:hypothetical protein